MTHEDLVTVASFGDPLEANIAKGALEADNIPAYLQGAEAAYTLWHIGSALGGVKLQVPQRDAERAAEVLRAVRASSDSQSVQSWSCSKCGAQVDAGFEVCWSCGALHEPQSGAADAVSGSEMTPHTDSNSK